MSVDFNNASILRFYGTDDSLVWDRSNDTVIVTRTLLNNSADEIERLRAALSKIAEYEREEFGLDCNSDQREIAVAALNNEPIGESK